VRQVPLTQVKAIDIPERLTGIVDSMELNYFQEGYSDTLQVSPLSLCL
jgi:hypothetical protein